MEIKLFTLKYINMPKYFIILYTGTELWYQYIAWLNKTYGSNWQGTDVGCYYGYDNHSNKSYFGTWEDRKPRGFENNPKIITLEQWDQWVNKKEIHFETY